LASFANYVLSKYGTCKIEVHNFIARYYYQDDDDNWVEVKPNV